MVHLPVSAFFRRFEVNGRIRTIVGPRDAVLVEPSLCVAVLWVGFLGTDRRPGGTSDGQQT